MSGGRADDLDREAFEALVRRANGGDPAALADLRDWLDANPSLWRKIGHMAAHSEGAWVAAIANGDALVAESLTREAGRLRAELLGDRPTALERLLASGVVVAHLELEYERVRTAEAPGVTKAQVGIRQARLSGAQRRFDAAVKSLATVRRLGAGLAGEAPRLRVFKSGGAG